MNGTFFLDPSDIPIFDDWFLEFPSPENADTRMLSVKKDDGYGCVLVSFISRGAIVSAIQHRGYPFRRATSRVLGASRSKKFSQLSDSLNGSLRINGMLGADDEMLDGESYLVQWIDGNSTTRLVLGHPREISDLAVQQFVDTLDALLRLI